MMKNSTLLKWTNNKNNKNGSKNWLHSPEALQGGHVVYLVKFLGTTEVTQSKGIDVVKEATRKLRFNQQIMKSEGSKTPKVELTISVDGIAIQQPKTKKILYQYPLHQISYCADDKAEKRFFSFIAKEGEREDVHSCYVFISDKLAEDITLTIGQAFDLAYRRFLETSNREIELRRQVVSLQHQLIASQNESSSLKNRLSQVSSLKDSEDVNSYMNQNGIDDLLFVNGEKSIEYPIIHSESPQLPLVPPRNSLKTEINLIDDLLPVLDEQIDTEDFDPRAEESSPISGDCGGDEDDEFDPRADEHRSNINNNNNLRGLSPIPHLVPPPRPSRPTDKVGDCFANDEVLAHFIEMKTGFSRGLSFGTTDSAPDFNLDSLDPLKN